MKGSGPTNLSVIDEFDGGVGWMAYPGEPMQRASHALRDGEKLWLVDPVDADGLEDVLAGRGDVAGIVLLLDRHKRDAAALARRFDVPVFRPGWMRSVDGALDAPVRALGSSLAGYEVHRRLDLPGWREAVLHHPESRTLIVPESVGTNEFTLAGDERLGVHPALRLFPPRDLLEFSPERVLVGHGTGVHERATAALQDAVAGSRRRAPRAYLGALRSVLT